jgi:hypothetical protein
MSGTFVLEPTSPTTHYDKVDETTADDNTTYIELTGNNSYTYFDFSAFDFDDGVTITKVEVVYRHKKDAAQTANIRSALKVNGTLYDTVDAGVNPANGTWGDTTYEYTVNPDTSLAWTATDLKGTGSNPLQAFGVKSTDANPDTYCTQIFMRVTYEEGGTVEYQSVYGTLPTNTGAITVKNVKATGMVGALSVLTGAIGPENIKKAVTGIIATLTGAVPVKNIKVTWLAGLPVALTGAIKKLPKLPMAGILSVLTGAARGYVSGKFTAGAPPALTGGVFVKNIKTKLAGLPAAFTGGITLKNIKLTWLAGAPPALTGSVSAIKKFYKTLAGAISVLVGGVTEKRLWVTRLGAITSTGVMTRVASFYRTVTGAPPALTGAAVRRVAVSYGGATVLTGAVASVKFLYRTVTGSLTLTGAFSRIASLYRTVTGGISSTGAGTRGVSVLRAGAIASLVGGLVKKPLRLLAGTLTLAGGQTRGIKRLLTGTLTLAGAAVKKLSVGYTGAFTLVGTALGVPNFGGSSVEYKTVTGVLSLDGGPVVKVSKVLSGAVASAGAVVAGLFRLDWTAGDAPTQRRSVAEKNRRGSESGGDDK